MIVPLTSSSTRKLEYITHKIEGQRYYIVLGGRTSQYMVVDDTTTRRPMLGWKEFRSRSCERECGIMYDGGYDEVRLHKLDG